MRVFINLILSVSVFLAIIDIHALPQSVNLAILNNIKEKALLSHSDELLIFKNNQLILNQFSKNISTKTYSVQSVTKSLTALTFLLLIEEGVSYNLQSNLSNTYPEFKNDERKTLKIRHLLTHTSGLVDPDDLWQSPDLLTRILKLPLRYAPDTFFIYSNAASTLMGNILDQSVANRNLSFSPLTEDPVITYLNFKILNLLQIHDLTWQRDAQGHLQTAGGITTSPASLLKIGEWLLQRPDLFKNLVDTRYGLSKCYGLMTWIVNTDCGSYQGAQKNKGFYMQGYGGQYLVIIPSRGIVAVRLKSLDENLSGAELEKSFFNDFPDLVSEL